VGCKGALWRGGLPPLGCGAAPKPAISIFLIRREFHLYDCYAVERGQAPSPQVRGLLAEFAQLIRLDNPHAILLFERKTPHGAGQLAGFDAVVFTGDQA
jgi:hypothetical protein